MNDTLDNAISRALEDMLRAAPEPPATWPATRSDLGRSSPSRGLVLVIAVLVAALGLLGIVVVAERPRASAPGRVTVAPPASTVSGATTPPTIDPTDVPGIFLPTEALPGYSFSDLAIVRQPALAEMGMTARYVRRSATGAIDGLLVLRASPANSDTERDTESRHTVHGLPAFAGDTGEGIAVSWTEKGVTAALRGIGLDQTELLLIAEQSQVTTAPSVTLPEGSVPSGFELSATDVAPFASAVTTIVELRRDESADRAVSMWSSPNHDQTTTDVLEGEALVLEGSTERIQLAGHEAVLHTSPTDSLGTMRFITWIEGAAFISVSGRADLDALLQFAADVRPASIADARALRATVNRTLLALTELDRAVLPSGIDLSVRTKAEGVAAICVHHPIEWCWVQSSEQSLSGEPQSRINVGVTIDGDEQLIGWAAGTHEPVVTDLGGSTAPVDDVAVGAIGTFLALPMQGDGTEFRWDDADDTTFSGALAGGNLLSP